jgi:hypothetical protein
MRIEEYDDARHAAVGQGRRDLDRVCELASGHELDTSAKRVDVRSNHVGNRCTAALRLPRQDERCRSVVD